VKSFNEPRESSNKIFHLQPYTYTLSLHLIYTEHRCSMFFYCYRNGDGKLATEHDHALNGRSMVSWPLHRYHHHHHHHTSSSSQWRR